MANLEKDMKQYLNEFMDLFKQAQEFDPEYANAFMGFVKQAEKPGALSTKTKELISVALGIGAHCPYCIAFHVNNAIQEGATKEELLETGFVAGLMGGGPAIAYLRYLVDAIKQFGAK